MVPDLQPDNNDLMNDSPLSRASTVVLQQETETQLFPISIVHPVCAGITTIYVRAALAIHIVSCQCCNEQMTVNIVIYYPDQDGNVGIRYELSEPQPILSEPPKRASREIGTRPRKSTRKQNSN